METIEVYSLEDLDDGLFWYTTKLTTSKEEVQEWIKNPRHSFMTFKLLIPIKPQTDY